MNNHEATTEFKEKWNCLQELIIATSWWSPWALCWQSKCAIIS